MTEWRNLNYTVAICSRKKHLWQVENWLKNDLFLLPICCHICHFWKVATKHILNHWFIDDYTPQTLFLWRNIVIWFETGGDSRDLQLSDILIFGTVDFSAIFALYGDIQEIYLPIITCNTCYQWGVFVYTKNSYEIW